MQTKFNNVDEALTDIENQVLEIEEKTGRSFEDLWAEAEQSLEWDEQMNQVHSLFRMKHTLTYLKNKEKKE